MEKIKKITVFFVSLLITLLFLEVILRLAYPLYSNYAMEMWRYGTQLKQKSSYPGLAHEHIPEKREQLHGVEIRTNSRGLRSDREYISPKPGNTKRVLALGDSITMGWGVRLEDTYACVLESLLNQNSQLDFEVINTGVGNYNSTSKLAALKKFIDLEPDAIILCFYINDLEDIQAYSGISYFMSSYSYLYAFIWSKLINIKYNLPGNDYQAYYSRLYRDKKLKLRAKDAVEEMIEIAAERSVPFMLINVPEMHNFKDYSFEGTQRFIKNIAQEHPGIIFIDLIEVLYDKDAEGFWVSPEDQHPNARMHKIIAETAYDKLRDRADWQIILSRS